MDELFKGYVPTKNKKCLMPFKDKGADELLPYDAAKMLPEFAGILAENTVLVDLDNMDEAECLFRIVQTKGLSCRVYRTNHGMHFMFHNDGRLSSCCTGWKLAIGLNADIKLGCKNSYSVLKKDGAEREIIYDVEGGYETVPTWLTPIYKNSPEKPDFLHMGSGDGRNSSLFSFILPLQKAGLSVEDCKTAIHLLNEFVLPQPLNDQEMSTILRDASFSKPMFFDSRNRFQFDKFAKHIVDNYDIIKLNEELHTYRDGAYVAGNRLVEQIMINEIPTLSKSQRSEVLSYVELIAPDTKKAADAAYIGFKNGIYNLVEDRFENPSPEFVITNIIPFDYKPDAKCDLVDRVLDKLACRDPRIKKLLLQAVGYTWYRRNELRKSFLLVGQKRNGKSTFLDMINTMLGEINVSNLDLAEIGDKFKTAEIGGKLANIGDDINDEWIPNAAVFKKVVSGERITVEKKGKDPYKLTPYCKFFFSANSIPRIGRGKDSSAITDRLVIVPFDAKFSKGDADYDPYIKYKLRQPEAIERLIALAMPELKELLEVQEFQSCEKIEREIREFEETNNPILGFFQEIDADTQVYNQPTRHVYGLYKEYCLGNNITALSNGEFSKLVKQQYEVEIAVKRPLDDGKQYKCFVKK